MAQQDTIVKVLSDAGVGAQAVYLFGSRARGEAGPHSDFDVAVLVPRPLNAVARWELQGRLATALQADVDLVDLRAASTVLRVEVMRDGVLIDDADPQARAEFEMYALSDYGRLQEERREILTDAKKPGWLRG